jgi:tartrate dehydrogenase/decarboxylase/D-malate dehydrogenase
MPGAEVDAIGVEKRAALLDDEYLAARAAARTGGAARDREARPLPADVRLHRVGLGRERKALSYTMRGLFISASIMATSHRIAVIPGDGIGKEVVPEGLRALEAAAAKFGIVFEFDEFPWSCDYYAKHGRMMPEDWIAQIGGHDAIFFGAVGWPATVPDHVSLWGSLIQWRRHFDQYVNLRPCRLMPGIPTPLAGRRSGDIDFVVIRENTEGEYSSVGGRIFEGTDRETVFQQTVFTRKGVDRIMRFAFELALTRPAKHVTSATKSNGISITMPYWDERFKAMAAQYPAIRTDHYHIDILSAQFVLHPDWFDVVVGSNLFGDILSDLGPAVCGTIGIAPSANINPERDFPSTFEPVHGSAPDIAGKGIANPIGQIWSGALMLEHLGHADAAATIVRAIEATLADRSAPRTPDLGGKATTAELGKAIAAAISRPAVAASLSRSAVAR